MTTTGPEPGSVSSGTMRPLDLLSTFTAELDQWDRDAAVAWRELFPEVASALADEDPEEALEEVDGGLVSEAVDELFDRLDYISPPGCHFGAHEGDGSDYGWWYMPADDPDYLCDIQREEAL